MNRRRVLTGAGAAFAASVAGCVARRHPGRASDRTADVQIRFWLSRVSSSASRAASVTPIVFGDLSRGEREIVRTALEDGAYTVDRRSESPPLASLRDRIERRTGNGDTLEAYLRRAETHYRVGFAEGGHIIAHPDR